MVAPANIGILDCGYGNIRSIYEAFAYIGAKPVLLERPENTKNIQALVLPGVGTFANAMDKLTAQGWDTTIKDHVATGLHFLGICVGMQIMMDQGSEYEHRKGLGLFAGDVVALSDYYHEKAKKPHIGWSEIEYKENSPYKVEDNEKEFFYFNHTYVCDVANDTYISAIAGNEKPWPVIVHKNNITGIQCHPEKSHTAGLRFLAKFVEQIEKS